MKNSKKIAIRVAIIVLLLIAISIFSSNPFRVESVYTDRIFPAISTLQTVMFGWLPFSLGDILYAFVTIYLLYLLIKNIVYLFRRGFHFHRFFHKTIRTVTLLLTIYLIFQLAWGINYSRLGIASQLGLKPPDYDTTELLQVQQLLLQKVNESKDKLMANGEPFPTKKELFKRADQAYRESSVVFPFLGYQYRPASIKATLFPWVGNYVGFTGYYNPFTGEAQVNTSVPAFLRPYIITHEIAHQLGYAKEDEANFAGYLAIIKSKDPLFHYSAYLDLYLYANREVYYFDTVQANKSYGQLLPSVIKDIEEWRSFTRKHETFIGPLTSKIYAIYLRWNNQPAGMRSYSMVMQMLMAYYEKFGRID